MFHNGTQKVSVVSIITSFNFQLDVVCFCFFLSFISSHGTKLAFDQSLRYIRQKFQISSKYIKILISSCSKDQIYESKKNQKSNRGKIVYVFFFFLFYYYCKLFPGFYVCQSDIIHSGVFAVMFIGHNNLEINNYNYFFLKK